MPASEAQREANRRHDERRRGLRAAIWLEPHDQRSLDRLMRAEGLPSRIAVLRLLMARAIMEIKIKRAIDRRRKSP